MKMPKLCGLHVLYGYMRIARQDDPDVDKSMLSTNHPDIDDHLPRRAVSLIEEVRYKHKKPVNIRSFPLEPS